MLLKAKYDPKEDRIQLTLHPADKSPQAFWLTRRQCVALLQVIQETLKALPPTAGARAAASKAPGDSRIAMPQASPQLARLRWRRLPKGLRLVFMTEEKKGMRLELGAVELGGLQKTLLQLARRAQWEVEATLQKLAERPAKPPVLH
ncbi:MAG: hypothetical protein N3A55_11155 [Methylohalobius sp.]|nr:hypothetical protein [Methylohalobius sp.]